MQTDKIEWKSDDKNLCKLQPRKMMPSGDGDADYEIEGDLGSFFWYFDDDKDILGVGHTSSCA